MHTDIHRTTAGGSAPRGLLRRLLARAAERRSIAQLCRLDERLLRDVGLTRADVAQLTAGRC
jgi:uncharacterized protein YjiS (DUF1127 family)